MKFETIESFELLRRAVRAEENEMKVATNLQPSRKRLRAKYIPILHLTYSKTRGSVVLK